MAQVDFHIDFSPQDLISVNSEILVTTNKLHAVISSIFEALNKLRKESTDTKDKADHAVDRSNKLEKEIANIYGAFDKHSKDVTAIKDENDETAESLKQLSEEVNQMKAKADAQRASDENRVNPATRKQLDSQQDTLDELSASLAHITGTPTQPTNATAEIGSDNSNSRNKSTTPPSYIIRTETSAPPGLSNRLHELRAEQAEYKDALQDLNQKNKALAAKFEDLKQVVAEEQGQLSQKIADSLDDYVKNAQHDEDMRAVNAKALANRRAIDDLLGTTGSLSRKAELLDRRFTSVNTDCSNLYAIMEMKPQDVKQVLATSGSPVTMVDTNDGTSYIDMGGTTVLVADQPLGDPQPSGDDGPKQHKAPTAPPLLTDSGSTDTTQQGMETSGAGGRTGEEGQQDGTTRGPTAPTASPARTVTTSGRGGTAERYQPLSARAVAPSSSSEPHSGRQLIHNNRHSPHRSGSVAHGSTGPAPAVGGGVAPNSTLISADATNRTDNSLVSNTYKPKTIRLWEGVPGKPRSRKVQYMHSLPMFQFLRRAIEHHLSALSLDGTGLKKHIDDFLDDLHNQVVNKVDQKVDRTAFAIFKAEADQGLQNLYQYVPLIENLKDRKADKQLVEALQTMLQFKADKADLMNKLGPENVYGLEVDLQELRKQLSDMMNSILASKGLPSPLKQAPIPSAATKGGSAASGPTLTPHDLTELIKKQIDQIGHDCDVLKKKKVDRLDFDKLRDFVAGIPALLAANSPATTMDLIDAITDPINTKKGHSDEVHMYPPTPPGGGQSKANRSPFASHGHPAHHNNPRSNIHHSTPSIPIPGSPNHLPPDTSSTGGTPRGSGSDGHYPLQTAAINVPKGLISHQPSGPSPFNHFKKIPDIGGVQQASQQGGMPQLPESKLYTNNEDAAADSNDISPLDISKAQPAPPSSPRDAALPHIAHEGAVTTHPGAKPQLGKIPKYRSVLGYSVTAPNLWSADGQRTNATVHASIDIVDAPASLMHQFQQQQQAAALAAMQREQMQQKAQPMGGTNTGRSPPSAE